MSLIRNFGITKTTIDVTKAVFVDKTVYGSPNVDRNQEAHYILIAKEDENQQLSFIDNINNTDPLNSIEYPFINSIDGAYRLICFIPLSYSNSTTYTGEIKDSLGNITTYANIVWDSITSKFYKAMGTNFSGFDVTDTTYWQVDPDFTTQVSSNKVTIFISDDIISFRYEDCLNTKIDYSVDEVLCGLCSSLDKLFPVLSQQLLLDGAEANNWQKKATRSEVILKEATKKYCC